MIRLQIKKKLLGANGEMVLCIDTQIDKGEFVVLSGKSGSGKTTLLRILAGLEVAEGDIEVSGEVWLSEQINLPPQKRKIGYVFQDYALFSNMTVEENLLFVQNDLPLAERLLTLTELSELKHRMPNTLSGGQQQRVAMCRAMMKRPKLLLMDEPLSALDPQMRTKLQNEILKLHHEFATTTILVSHDPSEIYRLASRVFVLESGKVVNDGDPKEVFLKTQGSQIFSFEGELLDIEKVDVIYVAIVSIGQQLVKVVVSSREAEKLQIGQKVIVSTKAFAPMII